MTILAIGDSFTFGAELPDVPVYYGYHGNDYYNKETQQTEISAPSNYAWPAILAKKLDTNVVNLGLVGGSNDRIFRLAVKETVWKKYDLVVCAWTGIDRFDFTLNNKDMALTAGSIPYWKTEFPWTVEFITNHYSFKHAEESWLTKVIALQEYLKGISQPYVFLKSINYTISNHNVELTARIDKTNCVDWESAMTEWCKGCTVGEDGHFLEDAPTCSRKNFYAFTKQTMKYKILIMGLPGSGKTTLAEALEQQLITRNETVRWYNADRVRELFSDWDFSESGRIRQATRMSKLAELSVEDYVILDFVAPLEQMRDIVAADFVVWVDTIAAGRFADTNKIFVPPVTHDVRVTEQNAEYWAEQIINQIFSQQLPS